MAIKGHDSGRSTRAQPSGVQVDLNPDEKVFYEDDDGEKLVGQHGEDADGEHVYVMWQTLNRNHSFSMSRDVFAKVDDDVTFIYVVDKKTKDLYKFAYETYRDAEVGRYDNLSPKRWEFEDFWESCADKVFRGIYD